MDAKDELQRLCAEGGSHARIKYLRNKIKRATIAGLRNLLRERGVRFNEFTFMTQWAGALGESVEAYPTDTFPDTLLVKHAYLTPEQAIAATLGVGTCRLEPWEVEPDTGTYYEMRCGCGYVADVADWAEWHFCPNCGRRNVEVVTS